MVKKIDFTKPVSKNLNDYKDVPDCFGQSFDITTVACSKCHDNEVCSIMYRDNVVEKKIKTVEGKVPKIMDKEEIPDKPETLPEKLESPFSGIDTKKLEKFLIDAADKNDPLKTEALLKYAMKQAKVDSREDAIGWLVSFIKDSGKIKTREGLVIRK